MGGTNPLSQLHDRTKYSKIALAVGFLSLIAGTFAAFDEPATGYELSIYEATPTAFWVGVGLALVIGLAVAVERTESSPTRDAAVLLGGLSMTAVVLLPLIRGYYQFGAGDSLTHLGWTRDVVAGRLDPIEMLYPGLHTLTIFVAEVLGIRLGSAQMIVVGAFVVVFFLFTTLVVRVLGRSTLAVPIGAFSALLLLPNNNVSIHLMAHPITQSLLFFPVIVYLLLKYVSRADERLDGFPLVTPMGLLLGLATVAIILVHPQGALNAVAVLVVVAGVQFLFRRYRGDGAIAGHRPVYVPTAIAIGAFLLWAPRHPRVQRSVSSVVSRLNEVPASSDEIAQRSSSLDALGGDILGLFAKLFLVSAIFCVIAALVVAAWYAGYVDRRDADRRALLAYVIASLFPLTVGFAVFFAASVTTQHFRYVGFLMVPVTVLGAIGISAAATRLYDVIGGRAVRIGLVVGFLLLLPLPLATVHASPTIYQSTADVTEMELTGTQTAVERMDRDVPFAGVRAGPRRAIEGTFGTVRASEMDVPGARGVLPTAVFRTNLTTHYDVPRYVPVSEGDYLRETVLYDGFRYPERGFEQLRRGVGVDRVHTNGGYRLYVLPTAPES